MIDDDVTPVDEHDPPVFAMGPVFLPARLPDKKAFIEAHKKPVEESPIVAGKYKLIPAQEKDDQGGQFAIDAVSVTTGIVLLCCGLFIAYILYFIANFIYLAFLPFLLIAIFGKAIRKASRRR
jgi:hypothetical protein